MPASMLWRVSRPIRTRCKPAGFIRPCQPALTDRPPSGSGWLHEIKFDGYRVIARRDGEQIRLWARTGDGIQLSEAITGDPDRARLKELAADLVRVGCQTIVAWSTPEVLAALAVTKTIPVV